MHVRSPPEAAPRPATRARRPSSAEQVRERARAPNAVNRHDKRSVSIRQSSYGVAIDGAHTLLGWYCDGAAIDRRRHYSNRGPQGSTVARGIFTERQSTYRSAKTDNADEVIYAYEEPVELGERTSSSQQHEVRTW